jgi:hypothetical protein
LQYGALRNEMRERDVQNEIVRTFGSRSDMRIWRANAGVARHRTRTVRYGVPGQADLTGILPDGTRLEIECKSPTGRQSPDQHHYEAMIRRFGGVYVLARSVDDVWRAIAPHLPNAPAKYRQLTPPRFRRTRT